MKRRDFLSKTGKAVLVAAVPAAAVNTAFSAPKQAMADFGAAPLKTEGVIVPYDYTSRETPSISRIDMLKDILPGLNTLFDV